MPNTTPVKVNGHQARGLGKEGRGLLMTFMGIIFSGIGGGLIAAVLGLIPGVTVPPLPCSQPVALAFCASFFIPGLMLLVKGLKAFFRWQRMAGIRSAHAQEPWRWDHDWTPEGTPDNSVYRIFHAFFFAAFLFVFLTPFHWLIFSNKLPAIGKVIFMGGVGFFDLAGVVIIGIGIFELFRYSKYGSARLKFEHFPFFVGEMLTVRLVTSKPIGFFNKISFTLQCFEEVTEGSGDDSHVVTTQLYEDVLKVEQAGVHEQQGVELPISFDIQDGPWGTQINSTRCRYWELTIHADTPGIDFKTTFLVPVYARTTAAVTTRA